jgi:hypothetical protein
MNSARAFIGLSPTLRKCTLMIPMPRGRSFLLQGLPPTHKLEELVLPTLDDICVMSLYLLDASSAAWKVLPFVKFADLESSSDDEFQLK